MEVTVRLVREDDAATLAALLRANRDFLAPWEPAREDESAADLPRWIYYLFALRDELPLGDDGWAVELHDQCPAPCGDGPDCTPADCEAVGARIWQLPGQNAGFADAMRNLTTVSGEVTGKPDAQPVALDPLPQAGAVALVGAPAVDGDDEAGSAHYERCFGLLQDMVRALRLATGAWVPNLSIERVWPIYFRLSGTGSAPLTVLGPSIITHGFPNTSLATPEQLVEAVHLLQGRRTGDPVEIYRDFELSARNAAWADGDYVDAVLKAAVAAEILIKHTAWLLTWAAAAKLNADPDPTAAAAALDGKPAQLVGRVLARRLKGNWNSRSADQPVGAWRHHIAQRRNAVIHRGYRPQERDMPSLVRALDLLEEHLLDRVACNAAMYPRTALLLLGPQSLKGRSAWPAVEAVAGGGDRATWLAEYLSWLKTAVPEDDAPD